MQSDRDSRFTELYRGNAPRMFAYALRQLRDRPLAEELVEEAFVRLLQQWDSLTDHPALEGWLWKTLQHLILTEVRLAKYHREIPRLGGAGGGGGGPGRKPARRAQRRRAGGAPPFLPGGVHPSGDCPAAGYLGDELTDTAVPGQKPLQKTFGKKFPDVSQIQRLNRYMG